MLKQVWDNTIFFSFIISFILTSSIYYKKFLEHDYYAGFTYAKALSASAINKIFIGSEPLTIKAVSNNGIYSNKIKAQDIINHPGFKKRYNLIISTIISFISVMLVSISFVSIIIIIIWNKFGKIAKAKDIVKGIKILSAKEVTNYLKKENKDSEFKIAGMSLIKNAETSHILITGTTGSGKTTCMNELLPQIREKNQAAVIIDYTGQMVKKYYKEGDVVISPDENFGYSWDFWKDIEDEDNLSIIANALFTDKVGNYDEMWNNASKQFFKDSVRFIRQKENASIADLYKLIAKSSLFEICNLLQNSASSSMLDPNNEKTALSLRTNTIAYIDWMENFYESQNKIAVSSWITEKRIENGSWIFLKSSPKQRTKIRNLYSILLDLFINQVMELGEDYNRRIWMIIDELASLKKLPSLATALSEFRKYGCSIIASIQSPHQLFELYGKHPAYAMLDQFNTKFIFRTDEYNFASYLCKTFGNIEYKEQIENYSYGASEIRDGVNISSNERQKPVITPDDIASLENFEAYVKLPLPEVRIAKIKLRPSFISQQRN